MTASVVLYSCLMKKLPKFTDVLWRQEINYNSAFIGSTFSRYTVVNLKRSIIGAKKKHNKFPRYNKFPRCGSNKGLSYFIVSYLKTNFSSFFLISCLFIMLSYGVNDEISGVFYSDTSTMIKSKT